MQPKARGETLEVDAVALDGDAHGCALACSRGRVDRDYHRVLKLTLDKVAGDVLKIDGVGPAHTKGAFVIARRDLVTVAEQYQRSYHRMPLCWIGRWALAQCARNLREREQRPT